MMEGQGIGIKRAARGADVAWRQIEHTKRFEQTVIEYKQSKSKSSVEK
jgi:hypothetical protein